MSDSQKIEDAHMVTSTTDNAPERFPTKVLAR